MSLFSIFEAIFIGPLKLIFEYIYYFAYKVVSHPGLAVIALSMAMNILVLPLYRRADAMQEASRDVEAKLSKGVTHIKKVFSGDERMMMLQTYYLQNNYKPTDALKGSVSLLLEIPFFMAAYQFLSTATIFQNVSFGPIANLSAPDGLIVIGGITINLLPVLMTLINVISSAIYLKGFPLKTKIQLYAMAAFFLVFLYNSPSALVFYWTLNNLFSLVKTVFYKLKNPKKAAMGLLLVAGIGIMVFGLFFYSSTILKRKLFVVGIGVLAAMVPLLNWLLPKLPAAKTTPQPSKKVFLLSGLFLTLLVGALIPSTVISASPQEFISPIKFYNPLFFVLHTLCMSVGTFLVWFQVFYWLANDKGKVIFEKLMFILCGVMLVNYMFFGTDLGILNTSLQYERDMAFSSREILLNLAVLAVLSIGLFLAIKKWTKPAMSILLIAAIAVGGMSAVNVFTAGKSIAQAKKINSNAYSNAFSLSKTEENVVVIMLDRALGQTVPYIFQENPALLEQFDGFTYYTNVISYSGSTNMASPALWGGYEYTPVEINKRSSEALVDKHNEALKVLPVLFSENGFDVTVYNPVYANYQWIPDHTIFDEYEDINAYTIIGAFSDPEQAEAAVRTTSRNFFCFSFMKSMPLAIQPHIYGFGSYSMLNAETNQLGESRSVAQGQYGVFLNHYYGLANLPYLTTISDNGRGGFMSLVNDTTHEPCLLQLPDYTPATNVDNTEYDAAHEDRFVYQDEHLVIETYTQMSHYHANMAALLQIGNWLDFLREQGVYDNTRIILVSDHGRSLGIQPDMILEDTDLSSYFPMMLVKDFNAKGFTVSADFMTNADVPTLALEGLIADPVNPFTGKKIDNADKYAHDQFIDISINWDTLENNGNTFIPGAWARLQLNNTDDIFDFENWTLYKDPIVLTEHSAP